MYIDAHSHWADPRLSQSDVSERLGHCLKNNISLFLQGGVNPTDWENQRKLKLQYPENFLLSFGLHPYFVAENQIEACDEAMDLLAQQIHQCTAIGETGLDFREKYLVGEMDVQKEKQITFFENHIALSKVTLKPLVLHIVHAHSEALHVLKTWDPPSCGGLIHAFNGSYETATEYVKLGFCISVGGAVTFEKNKKLKDAVNRLPLSHLLIESDSPDQAPFGWDGLNDSTSLRPIADEIAKIKGLTSEKVLETTTSNFKRLFKL